MPLPAEHSHKAEQSLLNLGRWVFQPIGTALLLPRSSEPLALILDYLLYHFSAQVKISSLLSSKSLRHHGLDGSQDCGTCSDADFGVPSSFCASYASHV